jgi:hypothetical protein
VLPQAHLGQKKWKNKLKNLHVQYSWKASASISNTLATHWQHMRIALATH